MSLMHGENMKIHTWAYTWHWVHYEYTFSVFLLFSFLSHFFLYHIKLCCLLHRLCGRSGLLRIFLLSLREEITAQKKAEWKLFNPKYFPLIYFLLHVNYFYFIGHNTRPVTCFILCARKQRAFPIKAVLSLTLVPCMQVLLYTCLLC